MRIYLCILILSFIVCGIFINSCIITYSEDGENDMSSLPYEPNSSSELLSANHLFTVEILRLESSPWSFGADELERRSLQMDLRLLEVFKGDLDIEENESFQLEVEQRRESEFIRSDYYGLWSHIEPAAGTRYLVVANGTATSPAELMQEEYCEQLLDEELSTDVRAAVEAEEKYINAIQKNGEVETEAARMLLKLAFEYRNQRKDVFARYIWARVRPTFVEDQKSLLPETLEIIAARDGTIELRGSFISDLYATVLFVKPSSDVSREVLRTFFAVLLQEESAPLHYRLVEVQIYNLVFRPEKKPFAVESILPDSAERERVKAVITKFHTDRAREIIAWLGSA